jgi:hypothetical protein
MMFELEHSPPLSCQIIIDHLFLAKGTAPTLEFSLPNVFPFEIEIGPDRKPSSSRV